MSRCDRCIFRGDSRMGTEGRPGCLFIQHTGRSRLKEVYDRLGVDRITDEVREALRPENCIHYIKGPRRELDEKGIVLNGSPLPAQKRALPRVDRTEMLRLYEEGLNDKQIGARMGCRPDTVRKWRHDTGRPAQKRPPLVSPSARRGEKLLELYQKGMTDREIAQAMGTKAKSVTQWRMAHNLPRHKPVVETETMRLRRELYEQGLTDRQIAAELGITVGTVEHWRWDNHLPKLGVVRPNVIRKEEALAMLAAGNTDKEIAEAMGVTLNAVRHWRYKRGLPGNTESSRRAELPWIGRARDMLAAGKTDREIAEALGFSRSHISEWRRAAGLPINPGRRGRRWPERAKDGAV